MTNQPPIPPIAAPAPRRSIKFGGYMICPVCRYTEEFCGCGKVKPPPPPTPDGTQSTLEARVRAVRAGQ